MKRCQIHNELLNMWLLPYATILLFVCICCAGQEACAEDKPFVQSIPSSLSESIERLEMDQNPVVRNIFLNGNNKTKASIIMREIPFQIGDTLVLAKLNEVLTETRNNISNTSLFKDVDVKVKKSGEQAINISIDVKERWYIYPIPIFELADRNFNVWWRDYNRDFSRTMYGLKYIQQNLTGHADRLKIVAARGYKQKYWFEYKRPYIDRNKRFGLELDAKFQLTKKLVYG